MSRTAAFFVPGLPVAKGSTRAFKHKNTGAIITRQTNAPKQEAWASRIALFAKEHVPKVTLGPCRLTLSFRFRRPKSHFGTGRNAGLLKDSAPRYHCHSPDLDKLVRCVLDALTEIVWADDRQVVGFMAERAYATDDSGVGVKIGLAQIEDAAAGAREENHGA